VDGDEQNVSLSSRGGEMPDVARMQQVEDTVRQHHAAAVLLLIADERGGFVDAEHR